jgi:hypothetical protein
MRKQIGRRIAKVVAFLIFAPLAILLFGEIVEHLWNWLVPAIFGWHSIGFAQALGLLFLSRILFGRFGGHSGGKRWNWRRRMAERYEKMSPAEREKFRQGMRHRCGGGADEPEWSSSATSDIGL